MLRTFGRAAIGFAVALPLVLLPPTAAAEPSPDKPVNEAGVILRPRTDTVTLITGNQAILRTGPDGSRTATLERDGRPTSGYLTRQVKDELYVIPTEAAQLLAEGAIDEELFNVTSLVDQGYDDATTDTIPLLAVSAGRNAAGRPPATVPAAADRGRALPSASAVALSAPKAKAADVWRDLTVQADAPGPAAAKIWLDRKVTASLDKSVPAIGAPAAWAQGYDGEGTTVAVLDTGYDAGHLDLTGKVVASKNFTTSSTIDDRNGHGTHVASTVAGSGASSGGRFKGVAPATELMVGKVLGDTGSGQLSWIISGMQWAVAQGADVVNMSLGSPTTDCTDPLAVAAEQLASTSDTLFVVAAGNSGRRASVDSPGCAPSVLTVGAVDNAGATASFSSRGPVAGEMRSKPDLAAPGVAITAARAGGRGDDAYTSLSGTSMATPHVAGAAAILDEAHPGWTPQRVKAALVSAANPDTESRVQEQGAGMLDVARAVVQDVLGPGPLDLPASTWPHEGGESRTRDVTYTNTGARPVTLDLSLDVTGEDNKPAPRGMVTLGAQSIKVPAGGTASLPVTVDPSVRLPLAAYGSFGGRLVARTSDGTQRVVTSIAFWVEPKTVDLTIRAVDRRGEAATLGSSIEVTGLDEATFQQYFPAGKAERTIRVRAGRYAIAALVLSGEPGTTSTQGVAKSVAFLGDPEIVVDEDTVLTYDARTATRIRVEADRPTEHQGIRVDYARWWDRWLVTGGFTLGKYVDDVYAAPTGKARTGGFEFSTAWRMYAPELAVSVEADGSPVPAEYLPLSPALDDAGKKPAADLVDAGSGTPAELATAGAAGQLVLVNSTTTTAARSAITAAKNAGATGVVLAHDAPGRWVPRLSVPALPVLSVTPEVEERLRERLAAGAVRLAWEGTPAARSPYVYNLSYIAENRINGDRHLKVHDDELARVRTDWYTHGQAARYYDVMYTRLPSVAKAGLGANPVGEATPLDAPVTRTEFYTPGPTSWWQGAYSGLIGELSLDRPRVHSIGSGTETWYKQPAAPAPGWNTGGTRVPVAIRQGNQLTASIPLWGDAEADHYGTAGGIDAARVELYRNGALLGRGKGDEPGFASLSVPSEDSDYRLRIPVQRSPGLHENWRMSLATDTTWRFRSARPAQDVTARLPLLMPRYDMDLNLRNLAPASSHHPIRLSAAGQPGYEAGRLVAARAWVSYGSPIQAKEITDWAEVSVIETPDGWMADVDNAHGSGAYVSLKIDLTDEHGNGVEQTIVRAYGVE
ncbi:S8 family serine peptidase [Streptomyces sp. NPDC002206]